MKPLRSTTLVLLGAIAVACSPATCATAPEPLEQSRAPTVAFMMTELVSASAHDLSKRPRPCRLPLHPATIAGPSTISFDWEMNEVLFLVRPHHGAAQLHRWELKTGAISLVKTSAEITSLSASRGSMARIERFEDSICRLVHIGPAGTRVLQEQIYCYAEISLHEDDLWISDSGTIRRLDLQGEGPAERMGSGVRARVSPDGNRIAYVTTSFAVIVVADVSSSGEMTARSEIPVGAAREGAYMAGVVWNADSTLTIRRVPKTSLFEDGPCRLHECLEFIQVDGDHVRRVARGPAIEGVATALETMPCPRFVGP